MQLKHIAQPIYSWNISPKHALEMNRYIHFGHLASLVWAKLILGRFCDAVLPDFSRFSPGSDDYLNAFFTDPVMGDIMVDMPQGSYYLRAHLLSFVC